jgi:hypothetical protein
MKKILIILSLVMIFSGCTWIIQDIIIDDLLYQTEPRDPITINNIKLQKNILSFNVSYGGGCEDHDFQLISTSFMESYPVQVNILLSHEDNDDPCDMWITETLLFNIFPLRESYQSLYHEEAGTIIMNIETWGEPIKYDF